jgi:hypothetical protein
MTLALAAALAACAGAPGTVPPPQSVSLPNDAVVGAGDPLRSAANAVSTAFANPNRLAGRPADAARAIAQMEYLTVALPDNPQLTNTTSTLRPQLLTARQEWRAALGIPAEVPTQPVINALYAAARALDVGDQAAAATALPPSIFTLGGQATLARLAALPRLPLTNVAAASSMNAIQRQDFNSGPRR